MTVEKNAPLWQGAEWVARQGDVPWGELEGKTVAITGATGLIGKTLVLSLMAHNELAADPARSVKILALVRNETRATSMFGEGGDVTILHWDASAPSTEGYPKADYVIHCANMTDSASFIEHPVEVIETTTNGARSMLEYARHVGARVLVLSTMEVYGQYKSEDPIAEDQGGFLDAMGVRNSYPEAKRLDEALVAAYASEFGVSATVARLAQTFGPGVAYDDRRVFAEFARDCVEGKDITLLTTGEKRNMYLSTGDAATGLLTVLTKGEPGRAYNVANDDTICSIREMAEQVADRFGDGCTHVEVKVDTEAAKRFRKGDLLRLDTTAARSLGWSPKIGLMDMYSRMIDQWKCDGEGLLMGELRRRTLAIFSAQYLPHMGGVENFTKELSSALERMGVHAIVVTSAYGDAPEHEVDTAGLEVFRLPSSQLLDGRLPVVRDGEATRALLGEVAKAKPDGVFVNTRLYALSLMGVRFARNLGITPVVLDHGSSYIGFGVPVLDSVVHAYEKAITRKIRSYSPKFYGVSEKSAEWLRTFGIIADGVIHNAIEAEEFRKQASRRDFRAELGIGPDVLLVCFVGRITNGKGVEVVTELARRFERRGKRIHFAIAGDGPDFKALKQHAPEYASVLGRLGRPDVAALFGQSDLHILPSQSEGLPTSLLEASAEGTPSLVFDVGGAREVIPSDSYGIVLDDESTTVCEEVLDWYLDNRDVLKEQGANVRKRVEHVFSWEETARKTIEACGV